MALSSNTISEYINNLLRQSHLAVDSLVGQLIAAFIIFALAIITGWIVYHIFEHYFSKWAKKTKTTFDDEIIRNTKKPVYFFVILLGCYYALDQLTALDVYATILTQIFLIAEIFLTAFTVTRIINVFVSWYAEHRVKKGNGAISGNILIVFKKFLHAIVYIFAFLFILYLSKVDLSGALVGLGVGGIAIAFALQNVLADAFSAFSIYFDRPFEIGDYIIIGEYGGTVTHISMKSTRIQLLQGEELVLSNKNILEKNIQNFKKMKKRRVVFTLGVPYDTFSEKLMKIPNLIKEIIEKYELTEVDMINFKKFGEFSLDFEIVYYINTSDYKTYMNTQHKINFAIKEVFEKENIDIAYPTQTLFIKNFSPNIEKSYQQKLPALINQKQN
jgi:small-conductance mechanosensitive channel